MAKSTSPDELEQLHQRIADIRVESLVEQVGAGADGFVAHINDLKAANHRLNERVRELESEAKRDKDAWAKAYVDLAEARQWARDLLARIGNLEWLAERAGACWREDVEKLEKALEELKIVQPAAYTRPRPDDINWEKAEGGPGPGVDFYKDFDGEAEALPRTTCPHRS